MDDAHDGPYAREPQVEDLPRICRALNDADARYVLIGGFAVIAHGGARATKDIDLLVDAAPDNIARVKQALRILEDRAVDQVADTDVARYAVVRVADEIRSCGARAKGTCACPCSATAAGRTRSTLSPTAPARQAR